MSVVKCHQKPFFRFKVLFTYFFQTHNVQFDIRYLDYLVSDSWLPKQYKLWVYFHRQALDQIRHWGLLPHVLCHQCPSIFCKLDRLQVKGFEDGLLSVFLSRQFAESSLLSQQQSGFFGDFNGTPLANNSIECTQDSPGQKRCPVEIPFPPFLVVLIRVTFMSSRKFLLL